MKLFVLFLVVLASHSATAELVLESGDWDTKSGVITVLNKKGCVAETLAEVATAMGSEAWKLQVIKLETVDGDFTSPIVIAFPEQTPAQAHYEAQGLADDEDESVYSMTLLQTETGNKSIVAARMRDYLKVIRNLRTGAVFQVDFLTKQGVTRSVPYSLAGSSKAIGALIETCR